MKKLMLSCYNAKKPQLDPTIQWQTFDPNVQWLFI